MKVVVTLILALGAVATMGFSTTDFGNPMVAVLADHAFCELAPASYSALEMLHLLDQSCYADLVNEIEAEVSKGVATFVSTTALIDSIYERTDSTGSMEDLVGREGATDTGVSASVNPSVRSTVTGGSFLSETDLAELELDRGLDGASDLAALVESIEQSIVSTGGSEDLLSREGASNGSVGSSVDPAVRDSSGAFVLTETDLAELELDRGLDGASDLAVLMEGLLGRIRNTSAYPSVDLLVESQNQADD
jgi:hypothetical protein